MVATRHGRRLDLKGRAAQAEALAQEARELQADRVAVGSGLDQDVGRHRLEAAVDGPDMEVMNFHDARHAALTQQHDGIAFDARAEFSSVEYSQCAGCVAESNP